MVVNNGDSVLHLKLGDEAYLGIYYLAGLAPPKRSGVVGFTRALNAAIRTKERQIVRQQEKDFEEMTLLQPILHLVSMHMIALNIKQLTDSLDPPLFELNMLQSLSLESCQDVDAILNSTSDWTPRLRWFYLRIEKCKYTDGKMLRTFLGSFEGLEHLSLLIEGSCGLMSPSVFINNHGRTLTTLV